MSIKKNSLSLASSLNTFIKNTSKNSRHFYFSLNNYSPIKNKFNSNKRLFMQGNESSISNKNRNYKTNPKGKHSIHSLFSKDKDSNKKRFYYREKLIDFDLLVKDIKRRFFKKYNGIINYNTFYAFNNQYTYFSYYLINDLISEKRFHFGSLLKEYSILYKPQELLIRYYKKNERYIMIKYLLNFVYKYDELSYDINKEIDDKELKEKLVEAFHHITSNQYLYEHLLDTDSLKGIKYLLKRINLNNKKAQYDYSYLEMTKNKIISEENKYIINAIKLVNEFMDNIKYLEQRLIKNFPLEKVPNCVPNYFALGIGVNVSLKKYSIQRKYDKKMKPSDETKRLINIYNKKFSNSELYNNMNNISKKVWLNEKKDFLDIDETIAEIESSLYDNENPLPKKIKKDVYSKKNFHSILPPSLYDENEKLNNINRTFKTFKKKKTEQYIINNNLLYDKSNNNNSGKRLARDPDTIDIEHFLYLFPKDKNKTKRVNSNFRKQEMFEDYNPNPLKDNIILKVEKGRKRIKSSFNKKRKELSNKLKGVKLKLEDDFRKNKKTTFMIDIPDNNKDKNNKKLNLVLKKDKNLNISQNQNNINNSIKTNQRYKIPSSSNRKKNIKFNIINKKSLSPNKKNISNLFGNEHYLNLKKSSNIRNQKRCFSNRNAFFRINYNNKKMNFSNSLNKNNSISVCDSLNKNNISANKSLNSNNSNIKSEKKINNKNNKNNKKNRLFSFKNTDDFINGFNVYYNRIKVKPNMLLNNLSLYNECNKYLLENKSNEFDYNSSQKRILSSNDNNNSPKIKKKEKSFFYENSNYSIEKISNFIKNQLNKSKQKNTKNITFKQVLKNSDFYSCDL